MRPSGAGGQAADQDRLVLPDWLLERRRRAEAALSSVVATSYLLGVSTRRMDELVETSGIASLSKSQVSRMAAELHGQVEALRARSLDVGPYTSVCPTRPPWKCGEIRNCR